MACQIPYIRTAPLSETEKERLEEIHLDIFKQAKSSKAFKEINNRLHAIKSRYADATSFVGKVNSVYGPVSSLKSIGNGNAVLNVDVLPIAEEQQGVLFQTDNIQQSVASPETLKKVKDVIQKMGVNIQDLSEYAKEAGLDTKSISGVADITKGVIAVAEGKEGVALTEEMVHIATQILEQTNPKMITEMISKIEKFKIYKEVLSQYRNVYTLPNGKPDIRKIKKEAVDKLIAEIIVNQNENIEQYPELKEEVNQSLVRKWWNTILDWVRGIYKSTNISIFEEAANTILNLQNRIIVDGPVFNPDIPEANTFTLNIGGKYAGMIAVNDDGRIISSISQAGVELEPEFRGKGYGIQAYIEVARKLFDQGKLLKSELFGKDNINTPATTIWKSLVDKGLAIDKGEFFEFLPFTDGVFFQLTDNQVAIQKRLKDTADRVEKVVEPTKADPLLLDSEEASNFYRIKKEDGTWEKVAKRVTDRVKAWYKQRFGTKVFSDQEKQFNELKRTYGLQGHADFEEIHSRYYNEDGTKRAKPLPRPTKFDNLSEDVYDKLEKYYVDLVTSMPEGTLVFSEMIVYDEKQKEAGTLDFLAIEPSGKAHIFDWKFMSVNKGQEDVAWYKQGAYNIQIGRYKDILRNNYGVKEFGKMRAIPIIMDFAKKDKKVKDSPLFLKGIAIGTLDTSKIKDLKLMPVAEESESTGHEALDNVIKKLNAHVRQITKERASTEEDRQFKFERLNILNKAIRQAQITHNIVPLIEVIEVMRKEGDRILEDYNMSFKDRPATLEDSTNQELSDFSDDMRDFVKLSDVFIDIGDELGSLIYSADMKKAAKTVEEFEELEARQSFLDKLNEESRLIRLSQKQIKAAMENFADKHIGERNLVVGLLKPEKVLKGLGSLFRGVSDLSLKSLEILHKLTRAAQGKASEDALKEIQDLMSIREKLAARGGNLRELVKQVYQKDKDGKLVNKLIHKYSEEFHTTVDKLAVEGGDIKWLKENIDLEAYRKEASEVMKRQIESVKKNRYNGSPEEEEAAREREITRIQKQYDIDRKDFNGWNNYVIKRHPLDKWQSEAYKNITKDADLLELYNFIVHFNEKAKEIGYIDNRVAKVFLPFVRKSMAEQIAFDGNLSVIQKFQQELELRAEDVGYGNINEVTGELENSIPKYYTHDFTFENGVNDYSDVSEDLFKNLILYIQQVEKYKYLSEVEGQLKLVKTIEEFKNHLNTGRTGGIVFKDGKPQELPGNAENAKMYDDFLRVLLYDQKYVLSDTDTPLHVDKVINFVKNSVNRVAGREIWKPNEHATPTSMIKTIDALNRGFQLKTLGLEFISGAVNMFGGNIQMATQAGNYFKAREFAKNEAKLTLHQFESQEEKDIFAELINTFMPMKDDPAYELYNDAGMTTLTRQNFSDILMVFMRKPEQLIEKAAFLTLLENTMVVDGKMVNIREFVKSKYKDRYNSSARYREVKGQIESEIEELKKKSSIAVTRKLENGKLVIPGLDLTNRDELQRLTNLARRISRSATGGMTDGDINRMSMSIWTKSMMVFKGWIPKLADTRFSEFRKISDDFSVRINEDGIPEGQKYDIGRIRLLWYVMGRMIQERSNTIYNILALNDKGLNSLDEMFEEFRRKYEADTGEPLYMTREEFIDLMRNNLRKQLIELAILASLFGTALSLGFIAPEDDEDKAAKNFHRYAQRVVDKFVGELSFFYNPAELESILSGGIFPAIGLVRDFERFTSHFIMQVTGMDMNSETTFADVREKAKPTKYLMKMLPVTKPLLTYLSIFSDEFAKEMDITIQKETRR